MSDDAPVPRRRASDAAVDALGAHVAGLNDNVDGLRADLREDAKWRNRAIIGLAVAVVALIGLSIAEIWGLATANDSRNRIESCTTPEGECYRAGQANQAEAIRAIICGQDANTRLVVLGVIEAFGGDADASMFPDPPKECQDDAE